MKKTLLAVAVAAALPAAAFAQVTLYGVADIAVSKVTDGKAQMSANGGGNNGTSRLGVKGTEDLGGGLKGSFNYEMAVNPENGTTESCAGAVAVPASPHAAANIAYSCTPATYQRAAWLQLDGGFGSLRMGRSLSPSFYGVAAWELTGTANYSAQYNTFGAAGGSTRNSSAWAYTTPNMGGFTATLGYVAEGDAAASKIDMNAVYRGGPLVVAMSYNKVDNTGSAGWALGGQYNFGMGVLAASVVDQGDQGSMLKGYTLGGGTKLGPVAVVLDVARVTTSGAEGTNWLLEGKYPLSKATFAYATVLRFGSADATQTSFGIRHNF